MSINLMRPSNGVSPSHVMPAIINGWFVKTELRQRPASYESTRRGAGRKRDVFRMLFVSNLLFSSLTFAQEFVDLTSDAGIEQPANVVFSISWFDFDGDEWPDLYIGKHLDGVALGKEPNLLINQRDGTFADVFSAWFPNSIAGDTHGSQWIDFDNDGDMDLFQLRGGKGGSGSEPNSLFVNEGGQYVDRAIEYGLDLPLGRGRDLIWFDGNRDGLLDVLIANDKRQDALQWSALMEQGSDNFSDLASSLGLDLTDVNADSFRVSDLNADGFQDVVMLQSGNRPLRYFAGTANGRFQAENGFLPADGHVQDLVIGDFDGDNFDDLYIARARLTAPEIRPVDNRTFSATLRTRFQELGVTFRTAGEVTIEFRKEQIRSGQVSVERIHLGTDGMHPASIPVSLRSTDPGVEGIQPHSAGAGDGLYVGYDAANDRWEIRYSDRMYSRIDFFVWTTTVISDVEPLGFTTQDDVFLADTLLLFDPTTNRFAAQSGAGLPEYTAATSAVAADFDNDMDLDIYLAQETAAAGLPDLLLVNNGDATFAVEAVDATNQLFGPHVAHFGDGTKVVAGDYDNDGFVDLFLNGTKFPTREKDFDGAASQLLRNLGNANHWLTIDLVGSQSSRSAIGSRVWLTAGDVTQTRLCDGGKHRVAQNDSRLNFGLASHEVVEKLVIEWPSGLVETHTDIPSDQILRLVEGEANSAPVFSQDPFTKQAATVGVSYHQGIRGKATDADGDALSFWKVSGPAWLSVSENGAITGTPSAASVGTNAWTVRVADGRGGSDTATMVIDVVSASPNTAPVFVRDPFTKQAATVGVSYHQGIGGRATDADGDALSFSRVSGPAWLSVSENGAITGTPPAASVGTNEWSVRVEDGRGGSDTATMLIEVASASSNNARAFNQDPFMKQSSTWRGLYHHGISGTAIDADGDELIFSNVSGPAWLSVGANGAMRGTPPADRVGTNQWTVEVEDANGGSDTAVMMISVSR